MIVDLVLKTRITTSVCALLPLDDDRATVWHDQPGPHQQYPRLAERDLAVIDPDQASSLGDQTGAASWGVIDIFGNLRGDLSGKIRADACDESGRDDRSRLHHKWRRWTRKPIGRRSPPINGGIDEEKFAILPVLSEGFIRR